MNPPHSATLHAGYVTIYTQRLRDAELDLFAALICQQTQHDLNTQNAAYYLQKAKNRIEDIGQWGLMPRWEQVNVQIHGV